MFFLMASTCRSLLLTGLSQNRSELASSVLSITNPTKREQNGSSVSDEIASWSAMIVPIRFGGGTRVKIAEAFARRCPVVTTAVGAFGYDVHDGKEVLLADRPEDFASACVRLLRNPQLGEALSETAHKRFLQEWTWDSFQNNVVAVMDECLARRHDSRPLLVEHDNFRNVWDQ
jgi:hypothetical protein